MTTQRFTLISGQALGNVRCMVGNAGVHLADHAVSNGLRGHVGDSACRGGGYLALNVHLTRHAEVGHLGREAMGHR